MNGFNSGLEMTDENNGFPNHEQRVIPVIEEQLIIRKEISEISKVSISKKVIEEQVDAEIKIFHEDVTIEKKAIDEYIEGELPEIRIEGETTIIPVIKEVIIKRLLLIEELHITRHRRETVVPIHEVLRKEEITITRNNSLPKAE
jgi:uncharacterized protein (TIGR02271 family)